MKFEIEEQASTDIPLGKKHSFKNCVWIPGGLNAILYNDKTFEVVSTIKSSGLSAVPQKLLLLEKERSLISKVCFSNDCLALLTVKDEVITYDLIIDKLSRSFVDQGIL